MSGPILGALSNNGWSWGMSCYFLFFQFASSRWPWACGGSRGRETLTWQRQCKRPTPRLLTPTSCARFSIIAARKRWEFLSWFPFPQPNCAVAKKNGLYWLTDAHSGIPLHRTRPSSSTTSGSRDLGARTLTVFTGGSWPVTWIVLRWRTIWASEFHSTSIIYIAVITVVDSC